MRKGPNDVPGVVWAQGECFLISFMFFDGFIADMAYNIQITWLERLWNFKMMRKGPNDAKCVIWALGECFLISFMFFFSDNTCFIADVACNLQTT